MVTSPHLDHEEWYHLGIAPGFLINLLLETPFLLGQEVQSIVADLRKADSLDIPPAGSKGIVSLFVFACDADLMLLYESFVDGLSMLLRGVVQPLENRLRD